MLLHIKNVSSIFERKLGDLKAIFPDIIKENRVYGLMIGIDINEKYPVKEIINKLIEKEILTLRAGSNVLRLLPPYTIGEKEIDLFSSRLYEIFSSF
jgi:acetylornithine/N-succinyldiaminopimelate aminotransferase